jgi:hypothetical protein
MEDQEARAALEEHWSGSPADDLETALDKANLIYYAGTTLALPQYPMENLAHLEAGDRT